MSEASEVAAGKLAVDTAEWDAGFAKAGKTAQAWGDSVGQTASGVARRFGEITGVLIGAATRLGPTGALIGRDVGGQLGEFFGQTFSKEVSESAAETAGVVRQAFAGIDTTGGGVRAWGSVSAAAARAWIAIGNFGKQALDILRGELSAAFAVIQEPLARAADWFQPIVAGVGRADAGTQSWGRSIRAVDDAGWAVLLGLAYGVGAIGGLLEKTGGLFLQHIAGPATVGFGAALQAASMFAAGVAGMAGTIKAAGVALGMSLAGPIIQAMSFAVDKVVWLIRKIEGVAPGIIGKDLKAILDTFDKGNGSVAAVMTAALRAKLESGLGEIGGPIRLFSTFLETAARVALGGGFGMGAAGRQMAGRNPADRANQARDAVAGWLDDGARLRQQRKGDLSTELAPALLKDSREAANFIAQTNQTAAANGPAERAARAAEDSRKTQQDMLGMLRDIYTQLKDAPVLRAI